MIQTDPLRDHLIRLLEQKRIHNVTSNMSHNKLLQIAINHNAYFTTDTFHLLAIHADFPCIKMAHKNQIPWDYNTTAALASRGDFECFRYVIDNGCPSTVDTVTNAASNGHLPCLIYALYNNCPVNTSAQLLAADNGHLECLKVLHQKMRFMLPKELMLAVANQDKPIIDYLLRMRCPISNCLMEVAVETDNETIVKQLYEMNIPFCHVSCYLTATRIGSIKMMELLLTWENSKAIDSYFKMAFAPTSDSAHDVIKIAIQLGHMDVIKLLINSGFKWIERHL